MILERLRTCFLFVIIRDVPTPSGNIGNQFLLESTRKFSMPHSLYYAKDTVIISGFDPYFLDNRSLLQKGLKLEKAPGKQDKEGPFAYSSDFYEDGIKWYEDVWSVRLCHSIRGNIVDENKLHVEFTGKCGGDISKDEMQGCTDSMEHLILQSPRNIFTINASLCR